MVNLVIEIFSCSWNSFLYQCLGATAANRIWNDASGTIFNMYHPRCSGNETNILQCRYNRTNLIPGTRCSNYIYSSDETSVVCLPSKVACVISLITGVAW